jgi:hypothetical protein
MGIGHDRCLLARDAPPPRETEKQPGLGTRLVAALIRRKTRSRILVKD